MVNYAEFAWLSQSADSEDRGRAAHMAATAYLDHGGPADEHAALYAVLIGFLDDPSVKVRAALAYGLLHSADAPRPVIMALLSDSGVIARAVLQYSPILVDADIMPIIRQGDLSLLVAISQRDALGARVAGALLAVDEPGLTLAMLAREDIAFAAADLDRVVRARGAEAITRGALLRRKDLPAGARLLLVQRAMADLAEARIVKGAVAPERLGRLLRNGGDTAISAIGEREAVRPQTAYAAELIASDRLNTRVLLNAVITGHVMFFANCLGELSQTPREKVFTVLESGSRAAINALLARCGLGAGMRGLVMRLVCCARETDLADDSGARHLVVTMVTEELLAEYDGVIPGELEEAFGYLSEQNVLLARRAAVGVMAAFAGAAGTVPLLERDDMVLPAA